MLPDWLRRHGILVGRAALALALQHPELDPEAVALAGYLHDVGRSPLLEGDVRDHADLSALVLTAEGLERCAELARRHPVYAVLDPDRVPRTLAEKVVHYADRRCGLDVLSLDDRISETAARYPEHAGAIERARPLAHEIEREVYRGLASAPEELAKAIADA